MAREKKQIAKNRKAFHDYEIIETFEAGIALTGTEVCSLRENNCQLTDCFVLIRKGEAWLNGLHISPYSHGNLNNPDPDRKRKLLLHKKQIRLLQEKANEKGMALAAQLKQQLADCRKRIEQIDLDTAEITPFEEKNHGLS